MNDLYYPLRSLREGNWFKLICGASFQYLPAVRNITLAYALAGVDCVDVAADPAVIAAAREALQIAANLKGMAQSKNFRIQGLPYLMVSLNDGEDPHFRKASFEPEQCPSDCLRPCERVCPAQAIVFHRSDDGFSGVVDSRCYGCGRCLPICPVDHISAHSYVSTPAAIAPLVLQGIDAVEIHTQVGRLADFKRLWQAIAPFVDQLKLVAISCPDGEGLIDYLWALYDLISPVPCVIWQTDGRPMSGDIGDGATRAAIKLGQKVLAAKLPGYVQLAGGTNGHTVAKLKALGLLNVKPITEMDDSLQDVERSPQFISGVAYGSYARVLLSPILDQLGQEIASRAVNSFAYSSTYPSTHSHLSTYSTADSINSSANAPYPYALGSCQSASNAEFCTAVPAARLEENPNLLWQAVSLANSLVSQLKTPMKQAIST